MTFKLSKSLGFEQRCRQERKAGSYLKARMHHMNFQENQMEFSFPVNRNILFSNPILKWLLQNVSHIQREPGPNPSVLAPLQKILVKIQTQTCKLCLNGQLYLQHHQALGSPKQTDFLASARLLPCRALYLRLLLLHIPHFQLCTRKFARAPLPFSTKNYCLRAN